MSGKAAKGWRKKTRSKLNRKGPKATIAKILKTYNVGQKVQINIDSSFQGGMPKSRYQGITGYIEGSQGMAYVVKIKDINKEKTLVVNRPHLKELKEIKIGEK